MTKKVILLLTLLLATSASASAFSFPTNLKLGSRGEEVKNLQILLNQDPDTQIAVSGAGSPNNETTYFGPATKRAVINFQNKYKQETLTPIGLTKGTGFVGALTRKKLSTMGTSGTTVTTTTPTTSCLTKYDPKTGKLCVTTTSTAVQTCLTKYDPKTGKLCSQITGTSSSSVTPSSITSNIISPTPAYSFSGGGGGGGYTTPSTSQTQTPTPTNGGWSAYGTCSATACGTTGNRVRTCNNPTPLNGGAYCSGTSSETCSAPACGVNTYTLTATAGANGVISPLGGTTVSQGGSQTYTITPNAGYQLATLTIGGGPVSPVSSYTFTNVQGDNTINATFSAIPEGANPITLSLIPARTSGVAPLSVFFDATGTTDPTMTSRPFHDLEYTWDFGDPSSGTWANGAQPNVSSKNTATGPVSAHVFETPGTYTVTLTAFDGVNTNTTNTTITVDDPDVVFAGTNTICVSSNTTPTAGANGCPTGAQTVMQPNFATAINTYALTNRRVLFKRGDVFTGTTYGWLKVDGPGIIGAFGIDQTIKPIVRITISSTYNTPYLALSNNNTAGINDWRIMDLEFDGLGNIKSQGISAFGSIDQVTILRMNMHDIGVGILFDPQVLDYQNSSSQDIYGNITVTNFPLPRHIYDEIAIVDSTLTPVRPSAYGWRIYASAKHFSIMGNTLGNVFDDTSMGYHTIRNNYAHKYVLSNNTFSKSKGLALKLHAPAWCDATSLTNQCLFNAVASTMPTPTYSYLTNTQPVVSVMGQTGGYSEQIIISDNKIIGNSIAGDPPVYLFNVGPQNDAKDERLKDIILERNFFKAGLNTQAALIITGREITARNNICDLTGGTNGRTCIEVKPYSPISPAPFPKDIWVYNNTAYNGDVTAISQPSFSAVKVDLGAVDVAVKNNLGYSPLSFASLTRLLYNLSACTPSCVVESNNSTDSQIKNTSPAWASSTPSTPADFRLTSDSYGLNTGTAVKVFSDFFRNLRPQGSAYDMGAIEGL